MGASRPAKCYVGSHQRDPIRMKIKVSVVAMLAGVLIVGIPMWRCSFPTFEPLTAPLPLTAGSMLDQTFTTRTATNYSLFVVTRAIGPLKDSEPHSNSNGWDAGHPSSLPADLHVRISRAGHEIISRDFGALHLASYSSNHKLEWLIDRVSIPSAGRYRIELLNRTDLGDLKETEPILVLRRNTLEVKDRCIQSSIALVIGLPIFLLGLIGYVPSRVFKLRFSGAERGGEAPLR